MFADGSVLDTADPASRAAFLENKKDLVEGVVALAKRVQVCGAGCLPALSFSFLKTSEAWWRAWWPWLSASGWVGGVVALAKQVQVR